VKIIRSYFLMAVNLNLTKNWKHINSFVLSKTSKDELHDSTQNHARCKMTSLMKLDQGEHLIIITSSQAPCHRDFPSHVFPYTKSPKFDLEISFSQLDVTLVQLYNMWDWDNCTLMWCIDLFFWVLWLFSIGEFER
jgi:hypothetical protein